MAAPSYTHDLTDWIADNDTTAWGELTGAIAGGAPDEADTESALQGTNTVSQSQNTTNLCSMCRILGTPVTLSSGQVALVWHGHGVATALATYANNGLRVAFATDLGNWKSYTVSGGDVPPFPYGKWINSAVDPSLTADATNGTPPTGGTSIYGIGSMSQLTQAVAKGQPHVCDIIRYGRAEARFNGGDSTNGYATIDGFATLNDAQTARWGLIQKTDGGYLWKGLMTLGYTSAVDFRDSNKTIFVQDTRKVSSSFNKIEVRQATSRVDWTGMSLICLSPSTTASKGAFAVIDNADVNIDSCNFVDLDTFAFLSNSTILDSTFRRCGQITQGGATLTGNLIINSTAASSVLCDNPGIITDCDFVSDGSNHALELTSACAGNTYSLTNLTYTNYGAADTTNAAIYNNSGGAVTLNISGGDTPTIRNGTGASTTVVAGSVNVTVTAIDASGSPISSANVFLAVASGATMPYNASVTISNSGTTATVTHTAHGLATNDKVLIRGASLPANNGVFSITKINDNSYSYTMASTPGSSPTGTITATYVLIKGTTDANGEITMSRVFAADQPVTGWARKSTSAPYYKTGQVFGTVDSAANTSFTALLVLDQ